MEIIKVENIGKTYITDEVETPVLSEINFSIKQGEFVAIMGPSGSGKSTLLHIIGLLDKASQGKYFLDEKDTSTLSDDELAKIRNKKMGFVFQSFNLLPRTSVLENVKLPLVYSGVKESLWDELATKAIKSVGLEHRINHLSSQLSGGEKQRVAIARALVNDPQIIFADEPTGNLDSKSGRAVMEILQKLNEEEGHTVVLITHETYTAEHAQRIIHIIDGQISEDKKVEHRHSAKEEFKK